MLSKIEVLCEGHDELGNFEGYAPTTSTCRRDSPWCVHQAVKPRGPAGWKLALFHTLTRLVGSAEYTQDDHGLYQGTAQVSYARDAYELMKEGTDSMSAWFQHPCSLRRT